MNPGTYPVISDHRGDGTIVSRTPIDGSILAEVALSTREDYLDLVDRLHRGFASWKTLPPPRRGEIIRQYGLLLRENKEELGKLVSIEMGKSLREGIGEVQEMIDICDFAVGLSRQLYGKTIASERPRHHMLERWHPLGIVGIITAFNFPVAVWSWNAMIALVCGNVCLWKPSEKTPLCALACHQLLDNVLRKNRISYAISGIVTGDGETGSWLANDTQIPLISATGSVAMGRSVATAVAHRLGRTILELSGNNAMIITPTADLNLALTAAVFGAIGTAGQRCTTTRRLIIHSSIYEEFTNKLIHAYDQIKIGNPLDETIHMGPLIDQDAVDAYLATLNAIEQQGGSFLIPGGILSGSEFQDGYYIRPAIAEVNSNMEVVHKETFAPILYVIQYEMFDEAIQYQNQVSQGLSSSIMTRDIRESELFISSEGSDCGIANVNLGTSGAEIGGAFGGEKDTGGGRESGSDAWKAYMRRQTITINYGNDLPLAQGIHFDL